MYDKGYRWCGKCQKWYLTKDSRCPQCNQLLRIRGHLSKFNVRRIERENLDSQPIILIDDDV